MQPINRKKMSYSALTGAICLALSHSATAAVTDYEVAFETVPNITITPLTPMDFGAGLGLANGDQCIMSVASETLNSGDNFPGDTVLDIASGGTAAGANAGNLTGVGCEASANTKGTPGLYSISGVAGGTVKVTVASLTTGTDFNYAPQGCVGDYNAGTDGDTCEAIVADSAVNVVLATSADTVGNAVGSGIPAPGITKLVLGGTITATQAHTAGQSLSENFTLTVTY